MRILIVTDAWYPQINGVVRTLDTVSRELRAIGHEVEILSPDRFISIPCPTYSEIRLALLPGPKIARAIDRFAPDAIHIATEGPLGLSARRLCRRRGMPFSTSFHTKFPEYVHARFRLPVRWSYAFLRRFHADAQCTMVATPSVRRELEQRGFARLAYWGRGVDLDLFRPRPKGFLGLKRPISLYVGRIAVEKNIEAFLRLDLEGTKVVVGEGPLLERLKRDYPEVVFAGARHGEDLARHYADADVFVFPSLTDTFGNVLLEALASGVPVAAYPVTGPRDVLASVPRDKEVGVLEDDLAAAVRRALVLRPEECRAFAETFSWSRSARQFARNLISVDLAEPAAVASFGAWR